MDEQSLAARLDATPLYEGCGDESDLPERAAAELRRLHAEIERLRAKLGERVLPMVEAAVAAERERWVDAARKAAGALRDLERYEYATATADLRTVVAELQELSAPNF